MDQVQGRRQPQGLAGVSLLGRPDASQQDGNRKRLKEFKVEMPSQAQGGSLHRKSQRAVPENRAGAGQSIRTRGTGHVAQDALGRPRVGSHG